MYIFNNNKMGQIANTSGSMAHMYIYPNSVTNQVISGNVMKNNIK